MKEAGLRIRVEESLREAFVQACRSNDTTASRALREFMRDYLNQNPTGLQAELPLMSIQEEKARYK